MIYILVFHDSDYGDIYTYPFSSFEKAEAEAERIMEENDHETFDEWVCAYPEKSYINGVKGWAGSGYLSLEIREIEVC